MDEYNELLDDEIDKALEAITLSESLIDFDKYTSE